jgi:glyoxylase-like metal-dependent hydrolase (beta-lactamase superfamily II)
MRVECITVGRLEEQTYLLIDETSKRAFLIDPGAEAERILEKIKKENLTIEKILLTHGHFDHIGAVSTLQETLGVPVAIHQEGELYLTDPEYNLSKRLSRNICLVKADEFFTAADTFVLPGDEKITLKVIEAPGHTLDGVAFYEPTHGLLFVGDIIFRGSIGRTDFPGGHHMTLLDAIFEKILTLPENTVIYPGHGEFTTVGFEKRTNPYLNIFD